MFGISKTCDVWNFKNVWCLAASIKLIRRKLLRTHIKRLHCDGTTRTFFRVMSLSSNLLILSDQHYYILNLLYVYNIPARPYCLWKSYVRMIYQSRSSLVFLIYLLSNPFIDRSIFLNLVSTSRENPIEYIKWWPVVELEESIKFLLFVEGYSRNRQRASALNKQQFAMLMACF